MRDDGLFPLHPRSHPSKWHSSRAAHSGLTNIGARVPQHASTIAASSRSVYHAFARM